MKIFKNKIFLFIFVVVMFSSCNFVAIKIGGLTYSEGERTGTITKFSHKGLFFKTWEGELNMGGLEVGGKGVTWEFSVNDPEVVEKIHKSQRVGGHWTLKYRQQLFKQSWNGATEYFVTDVVQPEKE